MFTAREIKEHPRMMWKVNRGKTSPYLNKKIKNFEQHFQKLKNIIFQMEVYGVWIETK